MFRVGDKIVLGDKVGKITAVHNDARIGFLCEGRRSHTYDIEFLNIPEKDISLPDNGGRDTTREENPHTRGNELSPTEKTEHS